MPLKKIEIKKEYAAVGFVLFSLIIAVVFYIYIFKPLSKKNAALAAEIKKKTQEIAQGTVYPDKIKKALLENEQLTKNINLYQGRILKDVSLPKILEEWTAVAKQAKVNFSSIEPMPQTKTEIPQMKDVIFEQPIRIKMNCSYHQLGYFINRLENSERFVKISSLRISRGRDEWNHDIELVANVYSLVIYEEAPPAVPQQAVPAIKQKKR
jgi:Tfp pilus assembly protein PilO